MSQNRVPLREIFPTLHKREEFFDKITDESKPTASMISLYLLMTLFAFAYGLVMGGYHSVLQAVVAGGKVALLFSLVLLICFPAFFIIQFILGSRLKLRQMGLIMLSGFVLTSAIMVSFVPIIVVFLLTGANYYFLQLLHIAVFLFSGIFGMKTIVDALQYSCERKGIYPQTGVVVFRFWVFIMAFVGIQLAWNFRPFLGDRGQPFTLMRDYEGNFYTALIYSARQLVGEDVDRYLTSKPDRKPYMPDKKDDDNGKDSLMQQMMDDE